MNLNSNTNASLSSVLKKLQDTANTPFEESRPIPAEVNHSVEFYKHERNKVFASEWICIGREDEIPNTGDYLTHDIAGVPVFVIRQPTKEILGFVNACAHRFTCLLSDTTGNSKLIICPYHAWTYNLDGTLKSAPFMKMKDGFNLSDHKLRKLQTEIWEGFIYVTLDEHPTRSVNNSLEGLKSKIVGRYDMASYITVMRETMEWSANWKNLIENKNCLFLTRDPVNPSSSGALHILDETFSYHDLIASSDIIVTKGGYSTLATAFANHKPVITCERNDFYEFEAIREYLKSRGIGIILQDEQFYRGDWQEPIKDALKLAVKNKVPLNGEKEAIEIIHQFLS